MLIIPLIINNSATTNTDGNIKNNTTTNNNYINIYNALSSLCAQPYSEVRHIRHIISREK